jgi:DNA-binding NtrC family response regulator
LIVEDDPALARSLFAALRVRIRQVHVCTSFAAALEACDADWDLALVDVRLPDGSGVELCKRLCARPPRPVIVAISGAAVAREGFELAQLGVGEFVEKPFTDEELWTAIERNAGVAIEVAATAAVGTRPLPEVQESVRKEMMGEALARAGNNNSAASRLLGVSRQAVQQALRDDEER